MSQALILRRGGRLRALALSLITGVAACGFAGCTASVSDRDLQPIGLPELRELQAEKSRTAVLVIDPRSPATYAQMHIPGAENIMASQISGRKDDIDPRLARYDVLVVYGDNPGSAHAAAMAKRLMATGYKRVRVYTGGLSEWRRSGLPVAGAAASDSAAPANSTP